MQLHDFGFVNYAVLFGYLALRDPLIISPKRNHV